MTDLSIAAPAAAGIRASEAGHVREIDGLRGIAVAAVVLYHFAPATLSGGFVGVDVFFVVSGFLIGGILWREFSATGTVRMGSFLLRRLRRLAPAFFAMAAITSVFAYLVLLPFEFREYGKSLIASVAYLSNVQFFREAGYFDAGSETKLLLHTWSLSVEEQFYAALPLLMLLFAGRRRLLLQALGLLFLLSLLACVAITPVSPTATFFLFPFRAWELLAGVLLAIVSAERRMTGAYGLAPSLAGLAAIGAAILLFGPETPFPGHWAMLPVFGTVLLLANIRDPNPVNRLLGAQPLVHLGLVSYSLYLWHWPVLTLAAYRFDGIGGLGQTAGWLAVALLLATLSWAFVERPVRQARGLSPLSTVGGTALASLLLMAAGGTAYLTNGMPDRFGPEVRMHVEASADFLQDWSRCSTPTQGPLAGLDVCPIGAEGRPSFLVWGDSHVRAFKEGIDLLAHEENASGLLIWRAGCPPLFDLEKRESAATPLEDQQCGEANARIRAALPKLSGINRVLLVGRWSYYAEGAGTGGDAANTVALMRPGATTTQDQPILFSDAVRATVEELSQSFERVFVLEQVPEIPFYDSRLAARRLAHGGDPEVEAVQALTPRSEVEQRSASSEAAFRALATQGRITWLSSRERLCDAAACTAIHEGHSFYFDNNHLTNTAARVLRDLFLPVVATKHRPDSDAVTASLLAR